MADFMNPSADLQVGREAGWNDRQREIDDLLAQVSVLEERLAAEEAAKIPCPPKAEWFGIWPRWWIVTRNTHNAPGGLIESDLRLYQLWDEQGEPWGFNGTQDGCSFSWKVDDIIDCLPVAHEGYPVPVGWQVVGEGSAP